MRSNLVWLGLVSLIGTSHATPIPIPGSFVLTINQTIENGGGIVVESRGKPETDAAFQYRDVNKLLRPTIRVIAPGLAVHELLAASGPNLDVVNQAGDAITSVRRATGPGLPLLDAPKLKSLVWKKTEYPGRRPFTHIGVTAMFAGTVPPQALALVMYRLDRSGKTGKTPLSWGLASGDRAEVYRNPGMCELPRAFIEPAVGERVVVAWLDKSGRLSPTSAPITVSK